MTELKTLSNIGYTVTSWQTKLYFWITTESRESIDTTLWSKKLRNTSVC